ncbi:MAG TPA: ABC transporter permease [Candidatus Micrarchaeota archaeon]|nr:ABC transporter permease [Candidatus Micrarchaeota archaeon]
MARQKQEHPKSAPAVSSANPGAAPANGHGNGSAERLIDLGKVAAIVNKNWLVLKSDKIRLVMLAMFPIIMILIYGFTAGESPKLVAAGIVDYDNSFYSQQVQSYLYSSNLFSIGHVLGSQDEGKAMIDNGGIKILFVIPQGFGADIEAGRPATLSFMVDVSDPTIAEITRAYTQAFVQQISASIATVRIQEIGAHTASANAYLTGASQTLASAYSASSAPEVDAIKYAYSDSLHTSSATIASMSSGITKLRNSMGEPVDQNAIADSFNYATDQKAALIELANGDSQSAAMQQIGVYQGVLGSASRMASDNGQMHGAAMSLNSKSQKDRAAIAAAAKLVGNSAGELAQAQSAVSKFSPTPVTLEEIQPYGVGRAGLDFLIPSILALIIFQGAVMGLGRAVAGERQDGSLTRVFLTPTSNVTIITGTLLFYILLETVRSSLIVFVAMMLFGVAIKGSLLAVLVMIAIYAAGSTGLGMVLSVIAKSQEQYQSIAMLFSLPIMFLSGVFLPIETMPSAIKVVAQALPVTYMSDAMRGIIIKGFGLEMLVPDIAFLSVFALATVGLSVLLFKRELI